MALALPFTAEALAEGIPIAIKGAKAAIPYIQKYVPKLKRLPKFFSSLSKNPLEAIKSINVGALSKEALDITNDIHRGAQHLERVAGPNRASSTLLKGVTGVHSILNKGTKLSHSLGGLMSHFL